MMYYRRKILFSLLESFEGKLTRTQIQKLTFIFSQWQEKKAFEFVPYKFGCFSFQANQDLLTLKKRGFLNEVKENGYSYWVKKDTTIYQSQLKKKDRDLLQRLKNKFERFTQDELIKHTYVNFPYYSINSQIANKYLNSEQLEVVKKEKRVFDEKQLFSIGYEGISLEHYLNKLLHEDVKLLCDVRKNSFSMKYGFSKSQLSHACEQVGIAFIHIPELGIVSAKRKELKTQKDYDLLFSEYEATTLKENNDYLIKLFNLFEKYNRIAITCFEASHCMCHRGRITNALQTFPKWNIPISHL